MNVENLSNDFDDTSASEPSFDTRDIVREAVEKQRNETARADSDPKDSFVALEAVDERPSESERGKRDGKGRFIGEAQSPLKPFIATRNAPLADALMNDAAQKPDGVTSGSGVPNGFSPEAKAALDQAPPALREAIARREAEIGASLKRFDGLDRFVQMAEKMNTSLPNALEHYTQIEDVLRRDPVEAIERIALNCGLNPVSLAQAVVNRAMAGTPRPAFPATREILYPAPEAPVEPRGLTRNLLTEIDAHAARTASDRETAAFRANPDNRFINHVRGTMATLIQTGAAATLQDAYDQACWASPAIRAQLMAAQPGKPEQRTPALVRARAASKAVTGAPGSAARTSMASPPQESALETVRRAVTNARGAV